MENTIYDMLERYVEHRAAIYSTLMGVNVTKNVKNISISSDSEAKPAEELVKTLKPLKTAMTLVSTETSHLCH